MDSRTFEESFMMHYGGLYNLAMQLTGDVRDAEDLLQETLLRAWRFRDRFEPGTNAKAWIFTILRNTFINEYRRAKKQKLEGTEKTEYASRYHSAQTTDMTLNFIRDDPALVLSDPVLHALESIPEEYRETLWQRVVLGREYAEIAKSIGCPEGTVMSRLFRGKRQMRECLASCVERTARSVVLAEPFNTHYSSPRG